MNDAYQEIKHPDFKGKLTSGNLFDRYHGLEKIFPFCKGAAVLDIGCYNGMVSYKCAEAGAGHIAGLDVYQRGLTFAKELFEDISVSSSFDYHDLSEGAKAFREFAKNHLKPEYDIVLYLAVYQHLRRQNPVEEVNALTREFIKMTKTWFVFRTPMNPEVIALCEQAGLEHYWTSPAHPRIASLVIYKHPDR